jgi:hypothetical protein
MSDQIKQDEIGGAYSMRGGDAYKIVVVQPEGKRPTPRNSNKIWGVVVHTGLNRDGWRALESTAMNLRVT